MNTIQTGERYLLVPDKATYVPRSRPAFWMWLLEPYFCQVRSDYVYNFQYEYDFSSLVCMRMILIQA